MLFQVLDLTLAVELQSLFRVLPAPETVREEGSPPWMAGHFQVEGKEVALLKSEVLLLGKEPRQGHGPYVLVLDGGSWAFDADALVENVEIPKERIMWRFVRARPWMRGILAERLVAVVDLQERVRFLNREGQ